MIARASLQHLELGADASVQEVRRAYARRLKQVDPAAQPEDFQRLHEAYLDALAWCEARDRGQLPETVTDAPDAETVALASFRDFCAGNFADEGGAHAQLSACLDMPALLDLEVRLHFEGRLVERLAAGWQPGHEFIFPAAITCFGWDIDHDRLQQFGVAGREIEAALADRDRFEDWPTGGRPLQLDLLERVRHGRRPSETDLVRTMRVLDWLCQNFPRWMSVTVGDRNIAQWDGWHAALPEQRRSIDAPQPLPTHAPEWLGDEALASSRASRAGVSGLMAMLYMLLCFIVAIVLGAWLKYRMGGYGD